VGVGHNHLLIRLLRKRKVSSRFSQSFLFLVRIKELRGILIGSTSATFFYLNSKKSELINTPWYCISVITKWRTYDFIIKNKEELSNFHVCVECLIPKK